MKKIKVIAKNIESADAGDLIDLQEVSLVTKNV